MDSTNDTSKLTGRSASVVIVGGGIIGLTIARALSLRGVKDICLLERGSLGSESSFAAGGMLAPQAEADSRDEFFELLCQSRDLYPNFAASLKDESGIDIELDTTGTLYLAFSEHDQLEIDQRYEWQMQAGLPVEKLTAVEARMLEPGISHDVRGALRFPLDIQVENRRVLSALGNSIARLGVKTLCGTNVESIETVRHSVKGVHTNDGFISCETIVIAAGAWSTFLNSSVKVEPVRGQMVCLTATPQLTRHVIYSARGYIIPRQDGRLLAGSTSERAGFTKEVTVGGVNTILSNALEIAPGISALGINDAWSGLRPKALDGLPVVGACGEIDGLIFATGHYRNGILLAPLTGELIAETIVEGVAPALLTPFTPDRFVAVDA
jgi:glycine oxidase